MPNQDSAKKHHFLLGNLSEAEPFRPHLRPIRTPPPPQRDRQSHGGSLLRQIRQVEPIMAAACEAQREAGLADGLGLRLKFESFPEIELAVESLAREASGIEIFNVKKKENSIIATVFVPDGKLTHFEKLIRQYLEKNRDAAGRLRDNSRLLNTIKEIRAASLRELWTDAPEVFPEQDEEMFWWEVWLPVRKDRVAVVEGFRRLAELQEIQVSKATLEFPERTVLLAYTSKAIMQQSMMTLNSIAELRRAKETADFFNSLPPDQQPEWVEELLSRSQFSVPGSRVPHVCLLDTGVNNGHPLLRASLDTADLHTIEPGWGVDDINGHGTAMAGLALLGNLTPVLSSSHPVSIQHRLESVKILQTDGSNHDLPEHHGYLTTEAIARTEITDPTRKRVYGMAVTARDNRDRGRPSAWSATLDRLTVDAAGENETPRLFMVSGGNIINPSAWAEYPDSNTTDGIHDPGQSWNALTIGAFTELDHITEEDARDYTPIAQAGGLSPFSTTSSTWGKEWPLKPDVVFEGGNAANDGLGAISFPSLSLLTSNYKPHERLLTTLNATSAATALGCRMAARLMEQYPALWPESIRALIVHSATWTEEMRRTFLPASGTVTKKHYLNLIRHCGFGVPDLDRAMWSASNSLTMVIEADLYPFKREGSKAPALRDMNLHQLPWPLEELESLGDTDVEMRVTLSYFIEPNPSSRVVRSRYRYESHGLRFDVKRPYESKSDFRGRINSLALSADERSSVSGQDANWLVGTKGRHKGSLHSDIWKGNAADLASRGVLAVYPTAGWWKTRTALQRYHKKTRYALVVSIHVPEVDTDIYTAVENLVKTSVAVGV